MARKPKEPKPPVYSKLAQAHVTPELYQRIQKNAFAETISISSYIRRILQNHVPGGN